MLLMPLIPPDFHTQIAATSSTGEEKAQSRHVTVLQGRVDALETQASDTSPQYRWLYREARTGNQFDKFPNLNSPLSSCLDVPGLGAEGYGLHPGER